MKKGMMVFRSVLVAGALACLAVPCFAGGSGVAYDCRNKASLEAVGRVLIEGDETWSEDGALKCDEKYSSGCETGCYACQQGDDVVFCLDTNGKVQLVDLKE